MEMSPTPVNTQNQSKKKKQQKTRNKYHNHMLQELKKKYLNELLNRIQFTDNNFKIKKFHSDLKKISRQQKMYNGTSQFNCSMHLLLAIINA